MIGHAVILVAVIAVVKSDGECGGVKAFLECLDYEEPQTLRGLNGLPDEDFLNKHCSPAMRKIKCISDELQKCPEMGDYTVETLLSFDIGLNFLHLVCSKDPELKKGYLENVGCYNTQFPKMLECSNSTSELVDDFFESVRADTEMEDIISRFCLEDPLLYSCVVEETAKVCGEEGTEPLHRIVNELSSITIQAECSDEDELAEWQARFILFVSQRALLTK